MITALEIDHFIHIIPRGIAIGALISAPMGPIGMLVIHRTLGKGRWPAFFTGVGAALSDLVYCLLTGFCLSFITDVIDQNQLVIQILGSLLLIGFGLFLFRKKTRTTLPGSNFKDANYWSDTVTGFLLTFSNPLILFFIIGLFARFNFILPDYGLEHYCAGYLAIFAGAVGWWYVITFLVSRLRNKLNEAALRIINKIIGLILIGMGIFGTITAIIDLSKHTH